LAGKYSPCKAVTKTVVKQKALLEGLFILAKQMNAILKTEYRHPLRQGMPH
jgi:hypothetical protein